MQAITHYIKLVITFMVMTFFSSHLYGADTQITVASINTKPVYAGDPMVYHVLMTGKSSTTKSYKYEIKKNTSDLDVIAKFTNGVVYNKKTHKIEVPKDIDAFDMTIEGDTPSTSIEHYNVTIGNKTAQGITLKVSY